jgi:thiamine biosynthesis protein ThiI
LSDVVLISTAEFALKSHPVRQQLVRLLKRHIRFNLRRIGQEDYKIRSAGGFLVINGLRNVGSVAIGLARILGVSHADACERTATELSLIVECVAKLGERTVKHGETFAVRARRFEPSPLKGKEIEIRAGSEILSRLRSGVRVNLDSPDHTFRVFYGASDAYISARRLDGPGGLPVGSQGSLLGLATDPAYSPLAFYLLMKRGAMVWPVIADIPPPIGGVPPDTILQSLKRLRPYIPKNKYSARLITLDEGTTRTLTSVRPELQRALFMRLMFRAVKHLARSALGLVTADRFGQDGVESLRDLRAVDEVAAFPVYRPLLTLEDERVSEQLKQLELAEFEAKKPSSVSLSTLYESIIGEIRELEGPLQVEQLAQQLAAKSEKIAL